MAANYQLLDPRPIAASAPYTYFLPHPNELAAISTGDLVKVVFEAQPPSDNCGAERMWVIVGTIEGDWIEGVLDNDPHDIPGLVAGDAVRFPRSFAIDIDFKQPREIHPLPHAPRREFWDRCLVDQSVLDGELPVGYLYRELPDMGEDDDQYPDSGWRLRGDTRGCTDEQLAAREIAYVALGAVLNRDDSWLHLIEEPIGAQFEKEFETGLFLPAVED